MSTVLLFALTASGALVLGAAAGVRWQPRPALLAALLAFASGALTSALAFELFENAFDQGGLIRAAQSNEFEIITGTLAEEKALTESVAEIGEIIVEDHTGAQAELSAVAAELGVTLSTALSANQRREVARLERLSGDLFEIAWLQSQIRAHRTALRVATRQAKRGANRELRNVAIDALPILGEHLGALSHQQDDLERGED